MADHESWEVHAVPDEVPIRQAQSWRDRHTGAVYEVVRQHGDPWTRFVELSSRDGGRVTVIVPALRRGFELVYDPHTGQERLAVSLDYPHKFEA